MRAAARRVLASADGGLREQGVLVPGPLWKRSQATACNCCCVISAAAKISVESASDVFDFVKLRV